MQGTSVFNRSIPKGYLVCQTWYIEGERVGPPIQNKSVSCLSKHCDGEVPTCRPPRFQRQQLRELLIPPLSHCHYHQHYPPLPLHLIPPLPLPPPLSLPLPLQFLSPLPLHLLPPLLLLPPLSLNYCHCNFYHHHYHCYYIYFSTKIYRSPTAITGTFKVDPVIF